MRAFSPPSAAGLALGFVIGAMAAPVSAQTGCGAAVTVSPGDTLYRIATRCGTSVAALMQANPQVNPRAMRVGLRLRMPGAAANLPPQPQQPQQPANVQPATPAGTYTVRRGDTLAAIARRHGIPVNVLISLNAGIDPRFLRPGFEIRLPGGPPPANGGGPGPNRIAVTGTITSGGVECPALRADNGRLYTLAGGTGRFGPGDRVRVRGVEAQASICQQGTTIDVRQISAIGGRRPGVTVTGVITGEGVECPTLRGDDGRLYSLAGGTGRFGQGDRVQVRGQRAQVSFCMRGRTLEVASIRAAGAR